MKKKLILWLPVIFSIILIGSSAFLNISLRNKYDAKLSQNYINSSQQENDKQMKYLAGTTSDGCLKYTLQAIYQGNSTYYISLKYQWVKPPIARFTDTLALCYDDNLCQVSGYDTVKYNFEEDWTSLNGNLATNSTSQYKSIYVDSHGTTVEFNPSSNVMIFPTKQYTNQRGYIGFNVVLSSPNDKNKTAKIYGYYIHKNAIFNIVPRTTYQLGILQIQPIN